MIRAHATNRVIMNPRQDSQRHAHLQQRPDLVRTSLTHGIVLAIAGYSAVSIAFTFLANRPPSSSKPARLLVAIIVQAACFLAVVIAIFGRLPPFVVLLVGAVTLANVLLIKVCVAC